MLIPSKIQLFGETGEEVVFYSNYLLPKTVLLHCNSINDNVSQSGQNPLILSVLSLRQIYSNNRDVLYI